MILDIKDEIIKDFDEKNYEIYIGVSCKEPEYLEKLKMICQITLILRVDLANIRQI